MRAGYDRAMANKIDFTGFAIVSGDKGMGQPKN